MTGSKKESLGEQSGHTDVLYEDQASDGDNSHYGVTATDTLIVG